MSYIVLIEIQNQSLKGIMAIKQLTNKTYYPRTKFVLHSLMASLFMKLYIPPPPKKKQQTNFNKENIPFFCLLII